MSSSSVFGSGYGWVEYKTTASYGGKDMTTDTKSVRSASTYQGSPAIEVKSTITSSSGTTMTSDAFWDAGMSKILGGTMTTTVNGKTMTVNLPTSVIAVAEGNSFERQSTLTLDGIEPVSVPSGTYPVASKYTRTVNGTESTIWSAPGVSVPVKMTGSSSSGTYTMELVGWGKLQ